MFSKIYQKCSSILNRKKVVPVLVIVLFSLILILPQLTSKGMILGSDFVFHYNRFYETAMQIKTGNLSYFISLYSFSNSGRIVNTLYGAYFAYFQGFLVLLSKNWFVYQILSRFLLASIAGFSMYSLLGRLVQKRKIQLSLSLLYMMTFAIQYWTFKQGFSSWGAAIMPWCFISAIEFVKEGRIRIFRLAISVALMTEIHMLSAFFLICAYLPFYLYGFIKSSDKKMVLFKGFLSVVLCLFLSSNVWAGLIEVGGTNDLVEPFINSKLYIMTVNQKSYQWLTPLPFLLSMLFCLYFAFRHWRQFASLLRLIMGNFFLFLVLASSIFPWYTVYKLHLSLVDLIQFPFRFFIPATVLLIMAFAMILERYFDGKWSKSVNLVLAVLILVSLGQELYLQNEQIKGYHSSSLVKSKKHQFIMGDDDEVRQSFYSSNKSEMLNLILKSTPDYLPADPLNKENKYKLYEQYILQNTGDFQVSQADNSLTLTWTADSGGSVDIPLVRYAHTSVILNGKRLTSNDYSLTGIGTLKVEQVKGKNSITISYQPSAWFYPVLISNLISWILLIGYLIYR